MGSKLKSKTLYGIVYGDGTANVSYLGVSKWSPDRKIKVKGISMAQWVSGQEGNWGNVEVAKHREDFYDGVMNSPNTENEETENVFIFNQSEPYGAGINLGVAMQMGEDSLMFGDDWMEVDEDEAIYVNVYKNANAAHYSLYSVTIFYI